MRGLSDCSVSCLGSADWSPVVRSGGGNVQLRALALCVQEPQELAFFVSNTSRVVMHKCQRARVDARRV